jgi:GNAT superfamily N-acetyltransferase
VVPETLHGWLTLHWQPSAMQEFLGTDDTTATIKPVDDGGVDAIRTAIESILSKLQNTNSGGTDCFQLRLAQTTDDLTAIGRLVQGLADFENESDAVHVTMDQYKIDGGFPDHDGDGATASNSLFYCILIEKDGYTFGMAFCYVGYSSSSSGGENKNTTRFLYLEDLFLEAKYRGSGAGTRLMQTLAEVALKLQCSHLVWQALDWNTPALTFYNKIGAAVVDGLCTTRFAGESLKAFSQG